MLPERRFTRAASRRKWRPSLPVSEKDVLSRLSQIVDPDFQKDIVSLGFVKNIVIDGPTVSFDIQITTPACPVKDLFREQSQKLVGSLPGVERVFAKIVSPSTARQPKVEKSGLAAVDSIIAVASGKGGVGKSTVAAALAKELSQRGFKVGLLDTDIFGPSIPTLFDLHQEELQGTADNMIKPIEVDGLKVMSFGFWLGESPAIMRGPMVSNYIQQFLHQVAWGELDYLFLDLPPGTGDVQLTITQSVQLSGAVIVTTPQALSLADVGKGILMFNRVNVPVLGVIENMAYFLCDNCNKRHLVFGEGGAQSLSRRFGISVLAQLPLAPLDYGRTFNQHVENPAVGEAVDEVVRALGKFIHGVEQPQVQFDAQKVAVAWADGTRLEITNRELRASCQCAVCVNEFSGEQMLDPATIPADIHAKAVEPVGNYAIAIDWSDGHATGFFPYSRLRELAGAEA
jgi:ATP-binding protein involved in chromosome partitioning